MYSLQIMINFYKNCCLTDCFKVSQHGGRFSVLHCLSQHNGRNLDENLHKTFETGVDKHPSNLKWFINDTWYLLAVCKVQGMWLPQHTSHILGMPISGHGPPKVWLPSHVSCRLLALTARLHRPTGAH